MEICCTPRKRVEKRRGCKGQVDCFERQLKRKRKENKKAEQREKLEAIYRNNGTLFGPNLS